MTMAAPPEVEAADGATLGHTSAGDGSGDRDTGHGGLVQRFARDPWAVAGLVFLAIMILGALFAPLLAPHPPDAQDLVAINAGPSGSHWLGTDDLGRDVLSRILWGGRVSLRATFEIVGLAIVVALPLGLAAGFRKGWPDMVTMRLMDVLFSFPPLVLALTVAGLLGSGVDTTSVAIALVFVPGFVRLIRGEVLSVREEAYVESATSLGASPRRILRSHILPNVASPIIIQVALALGYALLIEAGLSFLGIGVQPPTPSWGGMLNEAYQFIYQNPWGLVPSGLAIALTALSFNAVADGLRDALGSGEPTQRRAGARRQWHRRAAEQAAHSADSPDSPGDPGGGTPSEPALLEVRDLRVELADGDRRVTIVDDLSFTLEPGEVLGLVGESGSGKTMTALAIMGLLPRGSDPSTGGSVRFGGRDLLRLPGRDLRHIRGAEIAMIFQDPMNSLNPAFAVGDQIIEQLRAHRRIRKAEARRMAGRLLERVGIPADRVRDYPHQFSGGMRQRVMIAMALSCGPKLLIADEPTTALDVTTEAQILALLARLCTEERMAMIFVTHDLGVVAEVADRALVLYAGQEVEQGDVDALLARPRHPYSAALLASMPQLAPVGQPLPVIAGTVPRPGHHGPGCRFAPRCAYVVDACRTAPVATAVVPDDDTGAVANGPGRPATVRCLRSVELHLPGVLDDGAGGSRGPTSAARVIGQPVTLRVTGLTKTFAIRSPVLRRPVGSVAAVAGVSLEILAGTTLGLVGESGSGKSTLARMVMRLERPTAGHVEIDGVDMTAISGRALDGERRRMQMIFQDPFSSLDPRHTIGEIVSEPLTIHTHLDPAHRQSRVRELLALVGLEGTPLDERPRRLSGGQRQRVAIARALAVNPSLLVCDEPVSGLDVSTQAQVLNLIRTLQAELGTTYLFISHDLSVVRHVSDRIAVMLSGRVVESGDAADVLERPLHPYTAALLDSVPTGRAGASLGVADAERPEHPDTPVDNVGCPFAPRCAFAMDICRTVDPEELTTPSGSTVRCHLHSLGPALDGRTIRLLDRRSAGGSEPGPGSTPVHLTTRRS